MEVEIVRYEKPKMEVALLDNTEVIRTSGLTGGVGDGPIDTVNAVNATELE